MKKLHPPKVPTPRKKVKEASKDKYKASMALSAKSETYTKKIVNTLHWNVSGVNILQ